MLTWLLSNSRFSQKTRRKRAYQSSCHAGELHKSKPKEFGQSWLSNLRLTTFLFLGTLFQIICAFTKRIIKPNYLKQLLIRQILVAPLVPLWLSQTFWIALDPIKNVPIAFSAIQLLAHHGRMIPSRRRAQAAVSK